MTERVSNPWLRNGQQPPVLGLHLLARHRVLAHYVKVRLHVRSGDVGHDLELSAQHALVPRKKPQPHQGHGGQLRALQGGGVPTHRVLPRREGMDEAMPQANAARDATNAGDQRLESGGLKLIVVGDGHERFHAVTLVRPGEEAANVALEEHELRDVERHLDAPEGELGLDVLLPIAMWATAPAANSFGSYDATGDLTYSLGADQMGVIAPPFDLPQLVGGAGAKKKKQRPDSTRDAQWLRAQGFGDVLLGAPFTARAIRATIARAEESIGAQGLSDAEIVQRYVRNADWQTVGAHLAANPKKLAAVHQVLRECQRDLHWLKDGASAGDGRKLAALKAQVAASRKTGQPVSVSLTLKGRAGNARATLELAARTGVVQRIRVDDLVLAPTMAFVSRVMRDLDLPLASSVQVIVQGRRSSDPTLVDYIRTQVTMP